MVAPFAHLAREQFTVEGSGDASIYPHGIARPVSLRGKRDEEASVDGAAVGDRVVGEAEDVLPETKTGPEPLHCGEVVPPPCGD